jgi:hypothetical protein
MREFWFPIFLCVAGIVAGFVGLALTANGRRVLYSLSAVLFFLAVLSYIWGDPVTGPFANLIRETPKEFVFQGGAECHYPVRQLASGIDFSSCIKIDPGKPIEVWVSKTWWSGTRIRVTLKFADGTPIFNYRDGEILYRDVQVGDLNHDDQALELVTEKGIPFFQLIVAKDLSRIYVNSLVRMGDQGLILRDKSSFLVPLAEAGNYPLYRIFKYPSDIHERERNPDSKI